MFLNVTATAKITGVSKYSRDNKINEFMSQMIYKCEPSAELKIGYLLGVHFKDCY